MGAFLDVIVNVIVPILLCASVGWWFGKRFNPDAATMSRVNLYIFLPAFTFITLARSNINLAEIGTLAMQVFSVSIVMTLVGWLLSRRFPQLAPATSSAFVLVVLLSNTGNYGIPVVQFAFGEDSLQLATVIMVSHALVTNTMGVFVASSGAVPLRRALLNVLYTPTPYAMVLGFLVNALDIPLPLPLERSLVIFRDGTIPLMLVLFGVQMGRIRLRRSSESNVKPLLLAAGARLMITPVVAFLVTLAFGMDPLTRAILIVQLSTPTAVNSVVLASEFGSDSEFATSAILLTTFVSIMTISGLLLIVR